MRLATDTPVYLSRWGEALKVKIDFHHPRFRFLMAPWAPRAPSVSWRKEADTVEAVAPHAATRSSIVTCFQSLLLDIYLIVFVSFSLLLGCCGSRLIVFVDFSHQIVHCHLCGRRINFIFIGFRQRRLRSSNRSERFNRAIPGLVCLMLRNAGKCSRAARSSQIQGYLAHKKPPATRTLQ